MKMVSSQQMMGEHRRKAPYSLERKQTMPAGWVIEFNASGMRDQKADCHVTRLLCAKVSGSIMSSYQLVYFEGWWVRTDIRQCCRRRSPNQNAKTEDNENTAGNSFHPK